MAPRIGDAADLLLLREKATAAAGRDLTGVHEVLLKQWAVGKKGYVASTPSSTTVNTAKERGEGKREGGGRGTH
eukprot:13741290-Heterocapsa_arctica.AAC.1